MAAAQLPFFKTRCLGHILDLPRAEHDVVTIGEQHERFASRTLCAHVTNAVYSLSAMAERGPEPFRDDLGWHVIYVLLSARLNLRRQAPNETVQEFKGVPVNVAGIRLLFEKPETLR